MTSPAEQRSAAAPSPFPPIRHLGNFPQAFSHLALVTAAMRLVVEERLAEFS